MPRTPLSDAFDALLDRRIPAILPRVYGEVDAADGPGTPVLSDGPGADK